MSFFTFNRFRLLDFTTIDENPDKMKILTRKSTSLQNDYRDLSTVTILNTLFGLQGPLKLVIAPRFKKPCFKAFDQQYDSC